MGKSQDEPDDESKMRSFKLAESTMDELRAIAERQSKELGTKHSMSDALRIAVRNFGRGGKGTIQVMMPHYGDVPCGEPIDVDSPPLAMLDVFTPLVRGTGRFLLKAIGDSMTGKYIREGDTLVVQKQKTADSGQTVVARTEDGMTAKVFTAKTERGKTEFWLVPANDAYKPIRFNPDTMEIVGVVVGVVRKC